MIWKLRSLLTVNFINEEVKRIKFLNFINNFLKFFTIFSGITDTPSISSRGTFESRFDPFDASRTPVDKSRYYGSKFKASLSKLQERRNLDSIDEASLQPKASFSKSKFPSTRFKICLEQGSYMKFFIQV